MGAMTHRLNDNPLKLDQQKRLNDFMQMLTVEADNFLGYPCTREFDYQSLFSFLAFPLNNVEILLFQADII